jgi:hypothetical protein
MTNDIPQHFDEAFLRWFRERTEETWRRYQTRTFEEMVASRVGGHDWQQGTRWLGGLSEQEIATIEQHYHVRFPPDYRLFLQMLHSVNRPRVGARYVDSKTMIPMTAPSFYHWQRDTEALQTAYEWLVEGLVFDLSPSLRSRGNSAKGLSRPAARSFAALRMTGLDLAGGEELPRSCEPCLTSCCLFFTCRKR